MTNLIARMRPMGLLAYTLVSVGAGACQPPSGGGADSGWPGTFWDGAISDDGSSGEASDDASLPLPESGGGDITVADASPAFDGGTDAAKSTDARADGAPALLGWYCGTDPGLRAAYGGQMNLAPGDLYRVYASGPVDQGTCIGGCVPGGVGWPDYCAYAVDGGGANAQGHCWNGPGDYCGYNLGIEYSGDDQALYACDAYGGVTLEKRCPTTCNTNPSGPDSCN